MSRNISRALKILVFAETNAKCFYCGKKVRFEDFHCDHVIPYALGGSDEFNNLVCSCERCNLKKGFRPIYDYVSKRKLVEFIILKSTSRFYECYRKGSRESRLEFYSKAHNGFWELADAGDV